MKIDVYTATGTKKGAADLPAALFEAPIKEGLMHDALVRQQSNRRTPVAHVKTRAEVVSSGKKLYRQKGTGNARRGDSAAPILRGGSKAFGPRNTRNFVKNMPRKMRRAALASCLSLAAQDKKILGLEGYSEDHKTKKFAELLSKLPVEQGRKIVFVLPSRMESLERAAKNVPGVKTIHAAYLNPEDVLGAHHLVFLVEALQVAEEIFGGNPRTPKIPTSPKSGSSVSSDSSESSESSKKKATASTKSDTP